MASVTTQGSVQRPLVDADAARGAGCPFGAAPARDTPSPGGTASISAVASVDDRLSSAAQKMAEQGMAPAQIAQLLGMTEQDVNAVVARMGGGGAGRVLGDQLQKRLDDLLEEDPELCCPVSLVLFVDPVIASDGFMYEKASLDGLLRSNMASPMTRERLKKEYLPARQRKSASIEFRQNRAHELVKFAVEASAEQPQLSSTALGRVGDYFEVLTPQQYTGPAKEAADVWRKIGQPVPANLAGF